MVGAAAPPYAILGQTEGGPVLEERGFHRVVAAVLYADERALLCHRHPDRLWYPNVWDLPGGHVDTGESPAVALARELNEELGISVDPPATDPFAVLRLEDDLEMSTWAITTWSGQVTNCAPDEHDKIGWFARSELPSLRMAHPSILDLCLSLL